MRQRLQRGAVEPLHVPLVVPHVAKRICNSALQQAFAGLWGARGRRDGHHAGIASPAVHALVLADTHLRDDLSALPREVWDALDAADVVLHAGDVLTADLLDALRARVPLHAVLGNNDVALRGSSPSASRWSSAGCAWRWCTTPAPASVASAACAGGSPMPSSSCSVTATIRSTPRASTGSACSTPARPCSAGANRGARWASSTSWKAGSSGTRSCRSADEIPARPGVLPADCGGRRVSGRRAVSARPFAGPPSSTRPSGSPG